MTTLYADGFKDFVWTTVHASELSRLYTWKKFRNGLPQFVGYPFKYWYVWACLAFGVICSVYVPYFWVVYSLVVGFIFFKMILDISLYRPHSLYGLVRREYLVKYKDGTARKVVMQFPRWACQFHTDPYGTMHYELPELSNNSKVNSYIGTFPSYHAKYI